MNAIKPKCKRNYKEVLQEMCNTEKIRNKT